MSSNRRFNTVLFDIDGVMLSEERYFDGSALTVFELLCSPQYLGISAPDLPAFSPTLTNDDIAKIRRVVFVNDTVFFTQKRRGINANWDMVYLQVAFQLVELIQAWKRNAGLAMVQRWVADHLVDGWTREVLRKLGQALSSAGVAYQLEFHTYNDVFADCQTKSDLFAKVEDLLVEAVGGPVVPLDYNRALWMVGQQTFQEWYLGDSYALHTYQPGKPGFLSDEIPIVAPDRFQALLQSCVDQGMTIGIATGRPQIETEVPLRELGWLQYFDMARVSTASDVLNAELAHPEYGPLAKPNPFSYLRSFLTATEPETVVGHALPLSSEIAERVLIVGDSVADFLAAKKLGVRFAAVLTGLEGQQARPQFEELGADYIWNDVSELSTVLE